MLEKNEMLGRNRVDSPRTLAAAFAKAVTARCESRSCWVARNGVESIFRTLERVLPKVENDYSFSSNLFGSGDIQDLKLS